MEDDMTRVSTFCALSGMLAVLALSANAASAGNVTVHTTVPDIKIQQAAKTVGSGNINNGGGGSGKGLGNIRKQTTSATPPVVVEPNGQQ